MTPTLRWRYAYSIGVPLLLFFMTLVPLLFIGIRPELWFLATLSLATVACIGWCIAITRYKQKRGDFK